jgi:beta-xylosidase
MYPSPVIGGFNPDPSIVRVDEDYYLVNSTFEYQPGIPVHHSRDLKTWTKIGHVVTRASQADLSQTPTPGGAWAPTIRLHNGKFYVVVTYMFDNRTMIYSADNPAGPWSDGVRVDVKGIDPDLAWDDNGDCYLTFSGLNVNEDLSGHQAITQVQINLETGEKLEGVRSLWEGSGGMFPEGPHLYKIDGWWYLLTAEGGTDRGHMVAFGRSRSIRGPFENNPNNPVLTARSTNSSIQNKGHGDLVQLADGGWAMVFLGVRARGLSKGYSPLGRETFMTPIEWVDGWPVGLNIEADPADAATDFADNFSADDLGLDWIGVRRFPNEFAKIANESVSLVGEGRDMSHSMPTYLCKRQQRLIGTFTANLRIAGKGGISVRYNEDAHYDLEVSEGKILARFRVVGLSTDSPALNLPPEARALSLYARFWQTEFAFNASRVSPDQIELGYVAADGSRVVVANYDGRYLSSEVNSSFTGRALGVYCVEGNVQILEISETA